MCWLRLACEGIGWEGGEGECSGVGEYRWMVFPRACREGEAELSLAIRLDPRLFQSGSEQPDVAPVCLDLGYLQREMGQDHYI